MKSLWAQIQQDMKEGWQVLTEKTEELTKIGKIKLDIVGIKRKIERQSTELGGKTYHMISEGRSFEISTSSDIRKIMDSIHDLEIDLQKKDEELKELGESGDKGNDTPAQNASESGEFINQQAYYHPLFLLH
jgi:hypothetical protein